MILLDTHILIWLDQGSDFLGRKACRTIEDAHLREEVAISTISFWEIAMLIEHKRLSFTGQLREWRVTLLNSGFLELPTDGTVALAAAGFVDFQGDPADRMIAATAISEQARLVTADKRLLGRRGVRTINGLN